MKYSLLLIFCILVGCQEQKSTIDSPMSNSEKQIAMDLIQGSFDDLWAAADSTKILDYHTEDFIILEQGDIWDNARIKKYMRDKLARKDRARRINKMEYISIERYGESMQIAYWNDADFIKNDSIVNTTRWLESALAVKTTDGWRLKMMHSTRAKAK